MTKKQKRSFLFDLYSKNLALLRQRLPQLCELGDWPFLCPLCWRGFDRDALDPPERVSYEHAIAGAVGGTDATATLVCTECNTRSGTKLDKQLASRLECEAFWDGISKRPRRSTMMVGGFEARLDWHFTAAGRPESLLRIDGKYTKPAHVEGIKKEMQKLRKGDKVRLDVELGYEQRVTQIAMLRAAFLIGFRTFGYPFAVNQCVTPVLRQIHAPDEAILPDVYCIDLPQPPVDRTSVLIVKKPVALRSFMVVLRMKVQRRYIYKGVILPGPFELDASIYDRHLANRRAKGDELTVTFCSRTVEEFEIDLADPRHLRAAADLWMYILRDSPDVGTTV